MQQYRIGTAGITLSGPGNVAHLLHRKLLAGLHVAVRVVPLDLHSGAASSECHLRLATRRGNAVRPTILITSQIALHALDIATEIPRKRAEHPVGLHGHSRDGMQRRRACITKFVCGWTAVIVMAYWPAARAAEGTTTD